MPRFVILQHDWPTIHWDFLLESEATLRAWRLSAEPSADLEVPAEKNFDHRLDYLDYEGPLSGNRGTVSRWDSGTFEWIVDRAESVEVMLHGARISGRCVIEENWLRIERE